MGMIVKDRIQNAATVLTEGERRLAAAILSDYPYAGLASIQELAKRAETSAPSISRFVIKIGLSGYQEFQRELISELKEGQLSPIEVHIDQRRVEGSYLADFIAKVTALISVSAEAITDDQFDRVCTLLAEPRRSVYVLGGRISDTIASHISFHLRQIRNHVYYLPADAEAWPEYLLRMRQGDILFVVDFRRYQMKLEKLAHTASAQRNAKIVLVTDKWISPIAKDATEVLAVPIESGTLWDTYAPVLAVVEAIVTRIAEDNWDQTRERIEAWDNVRQNLKDVPE